MSRALLRTVRHPVATTSYAVGVVRGLAAEGIRLASGEQRVQPGIEPADVQPQRVPLQPGERHEAEMATAALVPEPPQPVPGEAFANEPHAASRDSAHGDAQLEDADVDRWDEDAEVETGTSVDEQLPAPEGESLLDPSVAKQVRSEAETMQQAAKSEAE